MAYTEKVVDLHIHSVHSDGTQTTAQLLAELSALKVDIFSFTDHDSVGCYGDLDLIGRETYRRMTLISGVELSFAYHGTLRDMLGYGINVAAVKTFLDQAYSPQRRIEKQQAILEKLKANSRAQGLIFDDGIEASVGTKSEAFILMHRALNRHPENVEKCPFIVDNTRFYWAYFANPQTPFFVDETVGLPGMREVVQVIRDAGGMAFLAHPCGYGLPREQVSQFVADALDCRIDGIEVWHASNRGNDVPFLMSIAESNGLFQSGGSDYHGHLKQERRLVAGEGNMRVPYRAVSPWIERIESRIITSCIDQSE